MDTFTMTQEKVRELLKQNAPSVYQRLHLINPVPVIQKQTKIVEEDDFIKGLEEDKKKTL